MSKTILQCTVCKKYTLKEQCICGGSAQDPRPAKYSPEDKYAKYRREVKEPKRREEGVL